MTSECVSVTQKYLQALRPFQQLSSPSPAIRLISEYVNLEMLSCVSLLMS